jgi:hypothetical protein
MNHSVIFGKSASAVVQSSWGFFLYIFEISVLYMPPSDWVSFLAYPNLFGIKGFVVVVVLDGKRN